MNDFQLNGQVFILLFFATIVILYIFFIWYDVTKNDEKPIQEKTKKVIPPILEEIKVEEPIYKICKYCAEQVKYKALKCKHFGEWFNKSDKYEEINEIVKGTVNQGGKVASEVGKQSMKIGVIIFKSFVTFVLIAIWAQIVKGIYFAKPDSTFLSIPILIFVIYLIIKLWSSKDKEEKDSIK